MVDLTPLFITIITFISTMGGGLFALRYLERYHVITAFAAGVLIAVPLFDLLPESLNLATEQTVPFIQVMYIVAIGFITLLILERYIFVHPHEEENECPNERHRLGGWVAAGELSIHSYLDGFAIGVGFQFGAEVGLIVAAAVIFHDFSDGLNTVTLMQRCGIKSRDSLKMLLLDATAPVLGVVTTLFFVFPENILTLLLPFFAGGFLYLGASDLLPEAHEKNTPLAALVMSLLGFLLIFIVTGLLNV